MIPVRNRVKCLHLELLPIEEKLKDVSVEETHKAVITEILLECEPVNEKLKAPVFTLTNPADERTISPPWAKLSTTNC